MGFPYRARYLGGLPRCWRVADVMFWLRSLRAETTLSRFGLAQSILLLVYNLVEVVIID